MTLTLELAPELEAKLKELVAQTGQDATAFVTAAVEEKLRAPTGTQATNGAHRPSLEEFEAALDEFSAGTESLPMLAPAATTRAAIYGDHD